MTAQPAPPTLDLLDARLRRVESRTSQLEDAVQFYGPPKERPLFVVRIPRTPTFTPKQTRVLIYAFLLGAVGLYTYAKFKAGEAIA